MLHILSYNVQHRKFISSGPINPINAYKSGPINPINAYKSGP